MDLDSGYNKVYVKAPFGTGTGNAFESRFPSNQVLPNGEQLYFRNLSGLIADLTRGGDSRNIPHHGAYQVEWTIGIEGMEGKGPNNDGVIFFTDDFLLWTQRTVEPYMQIPMDKTNADLDAADTIGDEFDVSLVPKAKDTPFSLSIASDMDGTQSKLEFLLFNGPDEKLTTDSLGLRSAQNTFTVSTPTGEQIENTADVSATTQAATETIEHEALKIWKLDINQWFKAHHLDKAGFYTLTWTFQGQKSKPFSLYVPTPKEKITLDKMGDDYNYYPKH